MYKYNNNVLHSFGWTGTKYLTSQKEEIDGHDKGVPEEDKERRSTLHL